MSFKTLSVMSVILVLACVGSLVHAQQSGNAETLPSELIGTNVALDAAQQRKLDDYAKIWILRMLTDQETKVSASRDKLISPLHNPSAGSVFKTAYSSTLLQDQHLPKLLKSSSMSVRFNAMLCVPYLVDKAAIPMVQQGLVDSNPAIRYLAAQAAGKLGQKLSPIDQTSILTLLNARFVNEADQVVVEQILGSMSQLTIPSARNDMLAALNMHVDVHHGNPNLTLKADRDAMLQLFRELVTEQANGQEIIFKVRKQFAIVACRFMIHCSRALDQNRVHKTLEPQYTSMITDCEKILNWISTRTMKIPAGNLPANDIVPNLRQQNWTVVHLRSEDWRKVMQASPFTVAQNQLAVPRP